MEIDYSDVFDSFGGIKRNSGNGKVKDEEQIRYRKKVCFAVAE